MRACVKMRCGHEPVVTVSLSYADREVLFQELTEERDPNLLDLCREHADRLTPPRGWVVRDQRAATQLAV